MSLEYSETKRVSKTSALVTLVTVRPCVSISKNEASAGAMRAAGDFLCLKLLFIELSILSVVVSKVS